MLGVSLSVYYYAFLERRETFTKRLTSRVNNNAQIFSYFYDSSITLLDRVNTGSTELLPKKTIEIYDSSKQLAYRYTSENSDTIGLNKKVEEETRIRKEYFYTQKGREVLAVGFNEYGYENIIVLVAAYDKDGWEQLERLKRIFIFALLIGIIVALIAGHLFSKQLLKPVAQIINEVKDISSHNLSLRIQTTDNQDELNQLANTFNELLDRLQEAFDSQRRFISNASHELSTPLTSISSQLQVTLQRERSIDEYHEVMQSVQEDVVQMRELTKSLLEIAKTGSEGSIELNEIRIDEILFKVMADMKKVNSAYKVELDFIDSSDNYEYDFLVFGNSDLLYIAVKNLVENGCKYSVDQIAKVNLSFSNQHTVIEVYSAGEPIAKEEMNKIFQPFYRSSNSIGKSGFGLGLALAKRIVGLHKGTLEVKSDIISGTVFTIILPTVS